MNTQYGTAAMVEILWTLFALPGFLLWAANLRSAIRDQKAVHRLGIIDERAAWAKFAILKNTAFMLIEAGFVLIGITAMLQPSYNRTGGITPTAIVMTVCLLSTSVLMTFVGIRWRQVSSYMLSTARKRHLASVDNKNPVE